MRHPPPDNDMQAMSKGIFLVSEEICILREIHAARANTVGGLALFDAFDSERHFDFQAARNSLPSRHCAFAETR